MSRTRESVHSWRWATLAILVAVLVAASAQTAGAQQQSACTQAGGVPAASSWGLAGLGLVVIASGVALQRRRRLADGRGLSTIGGIGLLLAFGGTAALLVVPVASAQTTTTALEDRLDRISIEGRGTFEDSEDLELQTLKERSRQLTVIHAFGAAKFGDTTASGSVNFWNNGRIDLSGEASTLRSSDRLSSPTGFDIRHLASQELLASGEVTSGCLVGVGYTQRGVFNFERGGRRYPVDMTIHYAADPTNLRTGFFTLSAEIRF